MAVQPEPATNAAVNAKGPAPRPFHRFSPPHIVTLVLTTALNTMSSNVFLPSLPGIARHFDTSYSVVQLTVSIYLAATALLQLVIGPGIRQVRPPADLAGVPGGLPGRQHGRDLCAVDRMAAGGARVPGILRRRNGAVSRHRAGHGRGRRRRLQDRLRHHGHGGGADDRANHRRIARRGLWVAGELLAHLRLRTGCQRTRLVRPGRDQPPAHSKLRRADAKLP